jgi:cation/acetate symporter
VVVSGSLGVARNQKLQYFVLIVTFILPLMLLTRKLGYFWLLPQFGYGAAISDLQQQFGFGWSEPFSTVSLFHWLALCFTRMFGTAGLPHVLSRFYMVPGIRDARWGVVWGLFFIALIYWSAPAYAVLGRLFEARAGIPFSSDPAAADMIILSAVSNAGLPLWVVGLLAAGGMSAAFSTVAGLILTGSASFSHDIYPRLIRPKASENDKVYAAKGFFLILALLIMALTLKPWGMIAEIAALAFALAGNTLFPAFLLGIWWDKANAAGVIAGMLSGVVITFLPFVINDALPVVSALLPATSSAFIGAPLVTIVMVAVSLMTKAPSESMRRFLARDVHDCTEE